MKHFFQGWDNDACMGGSCTTSFRLTHYAWLLTICCRLLGCTAWIFVDNTATAFSLLPGRDRLEPRPGKPLFAPVLAGRVRKNWPMLNFKFIYRIFWRIRRPLKCKNPLLKIGVVTYNEYKSHVLNFSFQQNHHGMTECISLSMRSEVQ